VPRTPTSGAEYWNQLYRRKGNRVIATRTGGLTYADSGWRDCQMILDLAGMQPPLGDVLEIGAGDGRISRWLPERSRSLTCVEPAEVIAVQLQAVLRPFDNARVLVGDVGALTALPAASFDLVFSCFVLQHIPGEDEIRAYLEESVRLLRPGGKVVHHLRRAGPGVTLRQTAVDVARLPTGMPKFSPYWRGCRFHPDELERMARRLTASEVVVRSQGVHLWLTISG
jgi:SAM-dependent methyltransferase